MRAAVVVLNVLSVLALAVVEPAALYVGAWGLLGPAYGDKAARVGLRLADLVNPRRFEELLRRRIKENNEVLKALGAKPLSFRDVHAACREAGDRLQPFVANSVTFLHHAMREGRNLLFEGAQGTFLDIDHGTYPFVTSSNTTAGGACTGSGVAAGVTAGASATTAAADAAASPAG